MLTKLPPKHFVALDSWRGLAAIFVALTHFYANSDIFHISLIRHAGLFVDFFFVLSGFVIAANYQEKIAQGYSVLKFLMLRLGRLYPLHLFILCIMIAFEAVLAKSFPGMLTGRQPFMGETSIPSIFTNLLLMNGLGLHDSATWNQASWSISVEFYVYILFAILVASFKRFTMIIFFVLHVLSQLILFCYIGGLEATTAYAYFRGLSGFMAGVFVWQIFLCQKFDFQKLTFGLATLIELCSLVCLIIFISFIDPTDSVSLFAPYFFGVIVWLYSHERGLVSRFLSLHPFVRIGTLSYSIYMVHLLVQGKLFNLAGLWAHFGGENLIVLLPFDGKILPFLGRTETEGIFAYVAMLILVYVASEITYALIEKPGRNAVRNKLQHKSSLIDAQGNCRKNTQKIDS